MAKRVQITPRAKADKSLLPPPTNKPVAGSAAKLGKKLGNAARGTYARTGKLK